MKKTNIFTRFLDRIAGEHENHVRTILAFVLGFIVSAVLWAPAAMSTQAMKTFASIVAGLFILTEIVGMIAQRLNRINPARK